MTGVISDKPFSRVTTIGGTMTRDEIRNYVYQLKMFLASKKSIYTHEEKTRIESEIQIFELIKHISIKISGK